MRTIFAAGVLLLSSTNSLAQQGTSGISPEDFKTTCQDVIDSKNEAATSKAMISLRRLAFDHGAQHLASVLYKALKDKGVASPLPAVLDQYENVYIPLREEAGPVFDNIVSLNGGLKNAIIKLCPDRKKDMFGFFKGFYYTLFKNDSDMKSNPGTP